MALDSMSNLMTETDRTPASIRLPIAADALPDNAQPIRWEMFEESPVAARRHSRVVNEPDAIVNLEIAFGHANLGAEDASSLRCGSVIPLDSGVEELVDVYAEGRRVARGEVLAINGMYGVRIIELFGRCA